MVNIATCCDATLLGESVAGGNEVVGIKNYLFYP